MSTWPAKNPEAVLDYRFDVPLDAGDTVVACTIAKLSGAVIIDSQSSDAVGVRVWLSGGDDGETAVFRASWTTTGGREDDEIITLAVTLDGMALAAAMLVRRYPAFARVAASTIAYWLTDAARIVTEAWGSDEEPGTLALAAHNMAINRVAGIADGGASQIPAGVTSFRSASMQVSVTEAAANRSVAGGYGSTSYGAEFAVMLRRNAGGPRLVGCVEPRAACW